jgi:hypothetical protein
MGCFVNHKWKSRETSEMFQQFFHVILVRFKKLLITHQTFAVKLYSRNTVNQKID